ncbi:MAG: Na+/H+ antiporter subunit E [Desulfovibrionaceae bacterium]|jgi:multicomponent K+:H+ antiporter subunit E|nr:Na+/H+ antiporter subunit E [Desulfovibrionaceae bacterium]
MMRRWLPAFLLSLALAGLWLALARSASLGHVLLAALAGLLLPVVFASLRPESPRMRRPWVLIALVAVVCRDSLLSNIHVFATLLRGERRPPQRRFVRVPLELRDPTALAWLCAITTFIPGSLWCEMAPDRSVVLIHVWDAPDEARFIADYKRRYEKRLMEIFE